MMKPLAIGVVAASLGFQSAPAVTGIQVSPNVQVTAGGTGRAHYEVVACADPSGGGRLLIGAMAASAEGRFVTEVYGSGDGGRSWRRTFEENPALNSFDPACAYGLGSDVFFVTIGFSGEEGWTHTALLRSADRGHSWEPTAPLPRSVDRPYLTVDQSISPHGRLYVHGKRDRRTLDLQTEYLEHLWIARSTDRGETFTQLDVPSLARQINAGNAVVLADGMFALLVAEFQADPSKNAIKVVRSPAGGASVSAPVKVADWTVPLGSNVTRLPVLAASGQNLYAAWPDGRSGSSEIMFSGSADGGTTWSEPLELTAADGGAGGFNPSIAVNAAGVVGVLWYDKRDHRSDAGWGIRFAASTDGRMFLPSVRVAEKDAVPGPALARPGRMSATGGDTSGLDASADGAFHAAWIDNRTGTPQVWSRRIVVPAGRGPAGR